MKQPSWSSKIIGGALLLLKPDQEITLTSEGRSYLLLWFGLLAIGLYLQSNLVLMIAGLAAGPLVASVLLSSAVLRGLRADRRVDAYAIEGSPFVLEYRLENTKRQVAVLATWFEEQIEPLERTIPGAVTLLPQVVFPRVPARAHERATWQTIAPARGRYALGLLTIITRSPFGLLERRLTLKQPGEVIVYPRVGRLTRGWLQRAYESERKQRGRRHDRSAMEQEYHGLRDYRAGDSLRWIHWRTTARLAQPMVKEFEHQHEPDLAILIDPWLPRSKVTPELREALEAAIRFAATLCVETCRKPSQRILLGWTGPSPELVQGFSSVKLLHEFLTRLALMRSSAEGQLHGLLDILPPSVLRDGRLIVVTTRAINLVEEAERSERLSGAAARGLLGRVRLLDASRGDLADLVQFDGNGAHARLAAGPRKASGEVTEEVSRAI